MKNIDPHHRSRAHFKPQFKCNVLLNNLCKCFSSQILEARTKGVVATNKMIRAKLIIRIQRKKDGMQGCATMYCPGIVRKLEKAKQLSYSYHTMWSGGVSIKFLAMMVSSW